IVVLLGLLVGVERFAVVHRPLALALVLVGSGRAWLGKSGLVTHDRVPSRLDGIRRRSNRGQGTSGVRPPVTERPRTTAAGGQQPRQDMVETRPRSMCRRSTSAIPKPVTHPE